MYRGDEPRLIFMISQKFWGEKRKSFDTLIFFGAPEHENLCNFLLRRDRWKNPTMETISRYVYSYCFTRWRYFRYCFLVKIPKYLIVSYQYSNPSAFSSAFKKGGGKEGCLLSYPFNISPGKVAECLPLFQLHYIVEFSTVKLLKTNSLKLPILTSSILLPGATSTTGSVVVWEKPNFCTSRIV